MLPIAGQANVMESLNQQVCAVDAIPDGGALGLCAQVDGETCELLLTRRGNAVSAFHNVCPHAGRRLEVSPGRFVFDQGRLMCASHGALFDPTSGLCVAGPCRGQSLAAVPVRVNGGHVELA